VSFWTMGNPTAWTLAEARKHPSLCPYLIGRAAADRRHRGRRWIDLEERVAVLRSTRPDGKRLVPREPIREIIFLSAQDPAAAWERFNEIRARFASSLEAKAALDELASEPEHLGGLLDAITAAPLLP